MENFNRNQNKIKYYLDLEKNLNIIFEFPKKRHFKFNFNKEWDGSVEDIFGLLVHSFVGNQVEIEDKTTSLIVKSGIKEDFDFNFYKIKLEEDEWCYISNANDEVIYARFIDYKEYNSFQKRIKKLVLDFFKEKGFEVEYV